jgi:two-component system nitrate/nitrite response regulator NarL
LGEKIRTVVIEDHPLFRAAVVQTLTEEEDFQVIGQAGTGEEALSLASDHLPDILLLDIGIPGSGLATAQAVADICPATAIVMLTASEDEENLLAALRAGAKAYVLKDVSARELVSIIRTVAAGGVYITPALANRLLFEMGGNRKVSQPQSDSSVPLTEREQQILELVGTGCSNKEIGEKLFLSEKTIKHYMTNILQKLQVRNRVEAALIAKRASMVKPKA